MTLALPSARSRFQVQRPLEALEVALVRACLRDPNLLDPRAEAGIRTALSTARLYRVNTAAGDLDVERHVEPLRAEIHKLLEVGGIGNGRPPAPEKLRPISTILRDHALRVRDDILRDLGGRLPADVLDREIRHKSLVVAAGGGGGTGYIYLGAYALLEEHGFRPALIAGTSMGSILGLFRARLAKFDLGHILSVVRSLSWKKLFRFLSMESRYGLPAALRLYLRAGIGHYFSRADGEPLRLRDLPVPLIVTVTGIRRGALPQPLEYYERLADFSDVRFPTPGAIRSRMDRVMGVMGDLAQREGMLERIYLGLDKGTEEFDAIDAVGFSSALPGVIHYDVVREDQRMHGLLQNMFRERELFRLVDGGVVDNVPAQAAWTGVQDGRIGTRNTFILALDGFAPKLSTPMWLPLQRLVAPQVARSVEYAHLYKPFERTLSPLELVPSVNSALKALERGKRELESEMPFITRMMRPLPALE